MKESAFIRFKIKMAIALSAVLFLIFIKSIIDKQNVAELEEAFISVYDDRLVVQEHIFSITEMVFRMRLLVSECASMEEYLAVKDEVIDYHNRILSVIEDFETTKLTPKEAEYLAEFKDLITNKLEIQTYFDTDQTANHDFEVSVDRFNADFERVLTDLRELSNIQLEEGAKLTVRSYEIKARSDIWLNFEYAVLFILLVLIVILAFTSKSIKKKSKTHS
ncbi:MAG: MCP four helix bundle domain-containing protein [Lunatimonas sp.]|uniref:MCP four helix bundle domain-containing protein n=1 Tax=Lunatimonas sp. TaxID=2060141 RepID=UPI00263A8D65|nr:MCP four helix bundle domain-containing protein [Lunatimonas sp.]MCC5936322.1 MCP four helix bundle domain-containing protein [Lunatimonas sp.]